MSGRGGPTKNDGTARIYKFMAAPRKRPLKRNNLKRLIDQSPKTVRGVAGSVEHNSGWVYDILSGETTPSWPDMVNVARFLKQPLEFLVEEIDIIEPDPIPIDAYRGRGAKRMDPHALKKRKGTKVDPRRRGTQ